MTIKLHSYHSRLMERLAIPSEAEHYINAALEDSNEMFFEAIKDVAQAHQMASVARKSGVTRESLYRSLSKQGNPSWKTVLAVLNVVGLEIPGVRETRKTTSPPTTSTSGALVSRRRRLPKKETRTAPSNTPTSYQMSFEFTAAASIPMPTVQQTMPAFRLRGIATNSGLIDISTLPSYLCSKFLERDYGHTDNAINTTFGAE